MARRLSPSAISSLATQILNTLQRHPYSSPRVPSLPLPIPIPPPLLHSILQSSTSSLLSLRFYLYAFTLPSSSLSKLSLSIFSSYLLPSLPHLLYSTPPFPLSLSSFRALFSLYLHSPSFSSDPSLPSRSLSLLRTMQLNFNCKPDTFCYNTVIRLFAESKQAEQSLPLYHEMCKNGASPNMVTYVSLLKGLARIGKVNSAHELISGMNLFGCKPNVVVYTSFLDGLCSFGDLDSAMKVLDQMEGNLGKECEPNVVTYTCLIKCLCENSRFDDVINILNRMLKRGIHPNRVLVQTILKGFRIDGHDSKTQELIDRLIGRQV